MANALIWFRNDLRLADNPALQAALSAGYTPIFIYIYAPEEEGEWDMGAASKTWLHYSLKKLQQQLQQRGARLIIQKGESEKILQTIIQQTNAKAVFWNRRYEPIIQQRDTQIKKILREQNLQVESFNSHLLFEPWQLVNQQNKPYRVFTPFWKNALTQFKRAVFTEPPEQFSTAPESLSINSLEIEECNLLPTLGWDLGFWKEWQVGELAAKEALTVFADDAANHYLTGRDRPDRVGTSLMSPYLHFGEISPWRIVSYMQKHKNPANTLQIDGYIRELGWREFAYHLLFHFPLTTNTNLNTKFDTFPWAEPKPEHLNAWRYGKTGVPLVDAGMRQLWTTGYMHNRVRMVVASFLCKHLRIHWLQGARWFWDTLVDADLASNTLGWQWAAGTGADAAPYFRVFNPVTQAQKFDPDAKYVSRWIPELAALPLPARFEPWKFPHLLAKINYPKQPIVDLSEGRLAALAAYQQIR